MTQTSVALFTSYLDSSGGGIALAVRELATALRSSGIDAHLYGFGEPYDSDLKSGEPETIHLADPFRLPGFPVAPSLASALDDCNHDILHSHGLWQYPSLSSLRWRRKWRRPHIISPHGMLDPWALKNSAWKKTVAMTLFERRALTGANCLHALNSSELIGIRALGLANPVAVIPNGVNLPPHGSTWPRPSVFPDQRRVLLFLGRIHPKKGLSETIAAWDIATRAKPALAREWVLVVAGWDDGGHLPQLQLQVRELGLSRSVHFPGPLHGNEKQAALHSAQAFILASHSEGQPIAVLEAWAHSTPVFKTLECNMPEAFAEGAAVRVETDPSSLATTLVDWLDSPALKEVGIRGRRLVEHSYSWPAISLKFAEVYKWLLSGGSTPGAVSVE